MLQSTLDTSVEMKLVLWFMIFVTFCKVQTFSSDFKNLKNAFIDIAEALSKQDRMVTIVFNTRLSDFTDAVKFGQKTGIPRSIVKPYKAKNILLNSSAIVSLESVESVDAFNARTILSTTFSMRQQLFVHCRNGTFDKLTRLRNLSMTGTAILLYEYFIVEEEKTIRLLTFIWTVAMKCGIPFLAEVNRYEKLSGRWKHGNFKMDKFANFNGCRIKFLIPPDPPEMFVERFDQQGMEVTVSKCSGYMCAIL